MDEIDRPLKVVEQCMQRLVMQHEQNLKDQQQQCIDEDEKSKSSLDVNENRTVDNQVKNEIKVLDQLDLKFFFQSPIPRPNSLKLGNNNIQDDEHDETEEDCLSMPLEQVVQDCSIISLNWQSFQNLKNCSCSTPLEPYSTRLHCFACGHIFCVRCLGERCTIPCHQPIVSFKSICRNCFKRITKSNSIDA